MRFSPAFLLLAVSLLTYLPGLTRHGVTNWQEGQRLVVARDMQARYRKTGDLAELLVPTVNGAPYLAKPPVVYWAQIALAEPFGRRVELFHLRLAVAIAGAIGVLATYAAALRLLGNGSVANDAWVRRAALWSGLCLATGVLYVRSSRIGELDVFLAMFVVMAIGAVGAAWRTHREHRSTNWSAVLVAVLATCGAALSKDPGVMVVGLGAYGGIALWSAWTREPLDTAMLHGRSRAPMLPAPRGAALASKVLAAALGVGAAIQMGRDARSVGDAAGTLVVALGAAAVGASLGRLANPARARALAVALSRTHPLLVLGVPIGVRIGWAWLVQQHLGDTGAVAAMSKAEVEDNLRLFVARAPFNNLEALAYGCGLGSVFAAVALVWLVQRKPALRPGWFQLLAWVGFGLLAFSVLGKGVPRYLTPLWPGVAILGGMGIATLLGAARSATPRLALATTVVALAFGQSWWYGFGRERYHAERSPQAVLAELRAELPAADRRWIFSFEFATPALDYHAGRRVRPVGDPRVNSGMAGGDSWDLRTFRRRLRHRMGGAILLVRTQAAPGASDPRPPVERLRESRLVLEPIPLDSRFAIDAGRTEVAAYRVRAGPRREGPVRGDTPEERR